MSVGLDMWRFSDDINTARRFNAVAARIQPHCPVLYSGKQFLSHFCVEQFKSKEKVVQ
jgi:hypothetical protein